MLKILADDILEYFSFFLFLENRFWPFIQTVNKETICMKSQSLFSAKIKKYDQFVVSWIYLGMVKVNGKRVWKHWMNISDIQFAPVGTTFFPFETRIIFRRDVV